MNIFNYIFVLLIEKYSTIPSFTLHESLICFKLNYQSHHLITAGHFDKISNYYFSFTCSLNDVIIIRFVNFIYTTRDHYFATDRKLLSEACTYPVTTSLTPLI